MSVLFYPESIRILGSDANGNNVMLCEMAVDDITNLPAANAFISDGYVLSMGCVATAINDNSKHRLNGSGNWIQIAAGTSTYTRAEIDAFLSAIDAEIAAVANAGAKNIFDIQAEATVQRTTTVLNPDGGITISCNAASWATRNIIAEIPAGDYICSLFVDAVTIGGGAFAFFVNQSNDISAWTELARQTSITSIGRIDKLISVSQKYLRITTNINNSDTSATNSATIRLMLRPASITDPTFQPYARTNQELTVLTDEDRAALVEILDGGAKNLSRWNSGTSTSAEPTLAQQIPFTSDGGEYTISYNTDLTTGKLYIGFKDSGGAATLTVEIGNANKVKTITIPANTAYFNVYAPAYGDYSNFMICTAADWAVSQKFAPYCPTHFELYQMVLALQSGTRSLSMQPETLTNGEEPETESREDER